MRRHPHGRRGRDGLVARSGLSGFTAVPGRARGRRADGPSPSGRRGLDPGGEVDAIFILLLVVSGAIILLVTALLLGFAIRYRRGSAAPAWPSCRNFVSREFEIGWTAATLFLVAVPVLVGRLGRCSATRPASAHSKSMCVAKQWMWKSQQPSGAREINELHVPVGRAGPAGA